MNLCIEDKLILSSIKLNPDPTDVNQLNDLIPRISDWNYFTDIIISRGIGPLFYKKITYLSNSDLIPISVKSKLQNIYFLNLSRGIILQEYFDKINSVFKENSINVIALKGIYLNESLYNDIGLRQLSDIDLLINEENGIRCLDLLTNLGFHKTNDGRTEFHINNSEFVHYLPMVNNGVSVELHIKLHKKTETYYIPTKMLWENAVSVNISKTKALALCLNDLIIHICIHMDKHFREGHIQFTCFSDLANLLEKYNESMNWNEFTDRCQIYNCESTVFKYIIMVNFFMNAPINANIKDRYEKSLTKKDKEQFVEYLHGKFFSGSSSSVSSHLLNIKTLNSKHQKFIYLIEDIFPSRKFMFDKYINSNKSKFLFRNNHFPI